MKAVFITAMFLCVVCRPCFADTAAPALCDDVKVTLNTRDMTIEDAAKEIARQSSVSIVVDPQARGKVSVGLNAVSLDQALDIITEVNGLTWRKLTFAKPEEPKVTLDELRSAILALASMPLVAMAVEDPATKTNAVFARDLAVAPDVSLMKLPDGYEWSTVYAILATENSSEEPASTDEKTPQVAEVAGKATELTVEMSTLTSEERRAVYKEEWIAQMNLTEEARRDMLRDRMSAMFGLDPQYSEQLRDDMRYVFRDMRRSAEQNGTPMPRGMHGPRD